MTIRPSGTEPIGTGSSDTLNCTLRKMKIDPQTIKFFEDSLPPKQVHGEHLKIEPSRVEVTRTMNRPMKEISEKLSDCVNLTPEMKADIEAGITIGDFIAKYGDALQPKNMGL